MGTEFFDHFGRSTRQANPQQAAIADSRRDTESGFVEPGDLFIGDQVSGHSPSNFDRQVAQIRTAEAIQARYQYIASRPKTSASALSGTSHWLK